MDDTPTSRRLFLAQAVAASGMSAAARPPSGFRSLFNGRTLEGWHKAPRLPVPAYPGGPLPQLAPEQAHRMSEHLGRWTVEGGTIAGGQEPAGSGLGAYLVSDETFADFELLVDARPDWRVDTGILIRAARQGSPGIQVLLDHRPDGNIGGFFGNGLGPFYAAPFWFKARTDASGKPVGLEPNETGSPESAKADPKLLAYAASVEQFLAAWRFGEWNTFRIRCEGKYPYLTTWINGVRICELDLAALRQSHYDREAVARLLGRSGHIAFEVHNNDPRIGKDRWWPGAVCRWRNVFVKQLT